MPELGAGPAEILIDVGAFLSPGSPSGTPRRPMERRTEGDTGREGRLEVGLKLQCYRLTPEIKSSRSRADSKIKRKDRLRFLQDNPTVALVAKWSPDPYLIQTDYIQWRRRILSPKSMTVYPVMLCFSARFLQPRVVVYPVLYFQDKQTACGWISFSLVLLKRLQLRTIRKCV